jgi:RNA polymerase sigma-70 factor (ECF subfamily)
MDAESFKKQYLPHHQKLYRIAYKLLGNQCDAEDMIQEAYLKLWNKREELAEIRNPESFSVILLKNICFDSFTANFDGSVQFCTKKGRTVETNSEAK